MSLKMFKLYNNTYKAKSFVEIDVRVYLVFAYEETRSTRMKTNCST